jgi:hypothetical protein
VLAWVTPPPRCAPVPVPLRPGVASAGTGLCPVRAAAAVETAPLSAAVCGAAPLAAAAAVVAARRELLPGPPPFVEAGEAAAAAGLVDSGATGCGLGCPDFCWGCG